MQQIAEVVALKDEEGLNFEDIGNQLGFSRHTASRRYQAGLISATVGGLITDEGLDDFPDVEPLNIHVDSAFIPEDKKGILRFKPLVCTGNAIVTCDYHIPLHDPALINCMITCARENDIKKLIIAGDYFNMEDFSSYPPPQPEANVNIERRDGNLVMKTLLQTFDEVLFFWGNHDFRLARKLGFKKTFEECMQWMLEGLTEDEWKKVRISDLDYMDYFPSGKRGKKYRICHPKNFSDVPLAVGRKLAVKYSCSIITAHSHHCAIGAATNGTDIIIEGGGFFDKNRTEYIQRTTDNHEWVQGFTMFKDGLPTIYSPTIGNDAQYRKEV